jgi:hypothetical protein
VSTAIATVESQPQSARSESEKLGDQITELCSCLYAAESRLLNLIRE